MTSRTKRHRIGVLVVLNEHVETHIADYLALDDLRSLRTTEKTARSWRYSAEKNSVKLSSGVRRVSGLLQCFNLVTSIDASLCPYLDDEGVKHIARHCPRLSTLNLEYCSKITDAGVIALTQCPQLSTLNLRWCNKITDAGVIALRQCPQLSSLTLYGCDNITDAGVIALRQCAQVSSLKIIKK